MPAQCRQRRLIKKKTYLLRLILLENYRTEMYVNQTIVDGLKLLLSLIRICLQEPQSTGECLMFMMFLVFVLFIYNLDQNQFVNVKMYKIKCKKIFIK